MRTPVILTNKIPTAEEVGRMLGVSPERTRELIRMADDAYRKDIAKNGKPKAAARRAKNGAARKRGGQTSAYRQ